MMLTAAIFGQGFDKHYQLWRPILPNKVICVEKTPSNYQFWNRNFLSAGIEKGGERRNSTCCLPVVVSNQVFVTQPLFASVEQKLFRKADL
jgi:hypothetical protein